ncbi:MAG: TetR/AcrR family transcriptional regulator [Bacteroidota bacterium]
MNKAEKTRQFIIEKTAPVFNRKGFAGTSLNDLTEATGLTKGSIYGNFANKDEVALAVFDYNFAGLQKGVATAISGSNSAIDKLLKMADFYRLEFKQTLAMGGCPILNTAIDADDTHPQLKEKVSASIRQWKKNIETIIKDGIMKGEVNPLVNASKFATQYIALIEGGIMLAKTTGDVSMLAASIERVKTIVSEELVT